MSSQAERDAQRLKETFDGLTESIRKSAEQSGKIRQTFLDLSSTANASGQAWTVISRLTSGTGFWKIQNRIRAISNFFQFQEKRLTEQVKREQEQIALIKDQISEREKLARAQEVVNKIANNTATMQERQAFFQSDQLKYYTQLFGKQNAIVKVTDKLRVAQENLNKVQGIRGENRANQMQKDLESELTFRERFFTTATGGRTMLGRLAGSARFQRMLPSGIVGGRMADFFRNIPSIEGTQAGLFRQMRVNEKTEFANLSDMIERNQSLIGDTDLVAQELATVAQELADKKQEVSDNETLDFLDEFELESLKNEIRELVSTQKELTETQTKIAEERETLDKDIFNKTEELFQMGITVDTSDPDKLKVERLTNPMTANEYLWDLYTKSPVYKIYSGIMKGIKDIPFGSIFKSLGIFLKSFLFYGTLILGLFVILKQTGILDKLIEFFGFVFLYLYEIYQSVIQFFGTFFGFISNLVNFVMATFTGSREDQAKALESLGESLVTFLLDGVFGVLSAIVGGIFNTVLLGGIQVLAGIVSEDMAKSVEKLREYLSDKGSSIANAGSTLGALYLFGRMIAKNTPLGKAVTIALLAKPVLQAIGNEVVDYFENNGKSVGGSIVRAGKYLVGEKGPELINLPSGSFINSNTTLRGMLSAATGHGGDTINIYISGRVGASETELRDIGNRLGDIINNRGNRVGNTRMFR